VASSPATGQYSVNTATGIYTFASGDTGASVLISYTFTAATTGTQLNITNQLMGFAFCAERWRYVHRLPRMRQDAGDVHQQVQQSGEL